MYCNEKTFKRYQKKYNGATFIHGFGKDSSTIDHIEETSSRVERGKRIFDELKGTYDTECTAIYEKKDGTIRTFTFTESVPRERIDSPNWEIDEDGNIYQNGFIHNRDCDDFEFGCAY